MKQMNYRKITKYQEQANKDER